MLSLCAECGRGHLYQYRKRYLDATRLHLGHHYDDVIETILMGMLYGGAGADDDAETAQHKF